MRCETATIWLQICGERKAFQTAAFCGRSLCLQSSKDTLLCVIEVVPTVGYGSRHLRRGPTLACNWVRPRCC